MTSIEESESDIRIYPIKVVDSSGYEPESNNIPNNVVDNDSQTRWSHNLKGAFLTLDLGQLKLPIRVVGIHWHIPSGELRRKSNFDIEISSDNTTNFQPILTGKQSNGDRHMEYYDLEKDYEARYIKITVNGNTSEDNDWASIISINILNKMPPPKVYELDPFGIKKIYPTKSNSAKDWYMDHNPKDDPRTSEFEGDVNGSGVNTFLKVTDHQVRMNVFAENKKAYDDAKEEGKVEYDQGKLANRKYMMLPNDWKNVEITAYFKVDRVTNVNDNGGSHFEWFCRGGPKHSGDSDEPCDDSSCITCEGTSYHANIYGKSSSEGEVRFEKELEHTTGYYHGNNEKVTDSLKNRWIGYKAVFYSFIKDGKEVVKLEQWLDEGTDNEDKPGNNWGERTILEDIDEGNWPAKDGKGHCGGDVKQIITWGGPSASFRSDEIEYLFKWASVREIVPPQ